MAAVPRADPALVGRVAEPRIFEYGPREVALYALSVGASARHLPLIWDGAPGGLKVLPTFPLVAMNAVAPQFSDLVRRYHKVEAGETVRLLRPLAPNGRVVIEARIRDLVDKGSFALLVTEIRGSDESGALFEVECSAALVGSGGFAGGTASRNAAPAAAARPAPRVPEVGVSFTIPENQAALYQLNGVDDPLHVDPAFARSRGFSRPILHGPCTFGYAARVVVERLCDGDPARVREIGTRFVGTVYPGDRLTVEAWRERDGAVSFEARTQRGPALTRGHAVLG